MPSTTSYGAYANPAWGGATRAGPVWAPPWAPPRYWPFGGKAIAIAVTVLGFIAWWPIGLAMLFFFFGSGRMGCRAFRRYGGGNSAGQGSEGAGWGAGPWAAGPWGGGWRGFCGPRAAPSSGNRAFDEYRAETLRRLEEEQQEFGTFLDRLRFAKDKAEFDQFMAERRHPPAPPEGPAQGPAQEPAPPG